MTKANSMKHSKNISDLVGVRFRNKLPTALCDLLRLSTDDMIARGVPAADARRIRAAINLAQEIAEPGQSYDTRITSPSEAMAWCLREFAALGNHGQQEEFWLVTLDTKNKPIRKHMITTGTLRNSLVHPREVFRPAIVDAASCIIVVHNHPSGDPTPSDQDISVTERLESAAEIIGIPLIDHIVVAGGKAISIQEWRSGNRW
jgi:DNA repair protein RadC